MVVIPVLRHGELHGSLFEHILKTLPLTAEQHVAAGVQTLSITTSSGRQDAVRYTREAVDSFSDSCQEFAQSLDNCTL